MMYFTNGIHFIIVPTNEITEEMKNNVKNSFDLKNRSSRVSVDGTKTLFKVKELMSAVFNGYKWYNQRDILKELARGDWTFEV